MSTTRYDYQDQVMEDQAVTVAAVSEDAKDLMEAGIDPSVNREMGFEIHVKSAPAGTVAATHYTFEAVQADNAALSTNLEVIGSSGPIAIANLGLGKVASVGIRKGAITRRYVGVKTTPTAGTDPTVTLDAYFCPIDEIASFKPKARPSGQVPDFSV